MSEFKLGPNQEKWLAALESGEWQQCTGRLHRDGKGYCCLGVANSLFEFGNPPDSGILANGSFEIGLTDCTGAFLGGKRYCVRQNIDAVCLTAANDSGATFAEIAAFIRANPEVVFKESK